jgi:hypothetical protein
MVLAVIGLCWGLGGAFVAVILAGVGRRNHQAKIQAIRALRREITDEEAEILLQQYEDDL